MKGLLGCFLLCAALLASLTASAAEELKVVEAPLPHIWRLPPGDYTVTETITLTSSIIVVGGGKTRLISRTDKGKPMFRVEDNTNVSFQGVTFDLSVGLFDEKIGVLVQNSKDVTFVGCKFVNGTKIGGANLRGIKTVGSSRIGVYHCRTRHVGLEFGEKEGILRDMWVQFCYLSDPEELALILNGELENVHVESNTIDGGISIGGVAFFQGNDVPSRNHLKAGIGD